VAASEGRWRERTEGDESQFPAEHKPNYEASDDSRNGLYNGTERDTSQTVDFLRVLAQAGRKSAGTILIFVEELD